MTPNIISFAVHRNGALYFRVHEVYFHFVGEQSLEYPFGFTVFSHVYGNFHLSIAHSSVWGE